eukprot:789277-Rhodomonas_salina.3
MPVLHVALHYTLHQYHTSHSTIRYVSNAHSMYWPTSTSYGLPAGALPQYGVGPYLRAKERVVVLQRVP